MAARIQEARAMRLDFKNIIPDALYSVSMAKRLLGIGQTTIYEYMKKCPPVLPYQMSENGWHRLILGSDIISLIENPQVKRGRRRKQR